MWDVCAQVKVCIQLNISFLLNKKQILVFILIINTQLKVRIKNNHFRHPSENRALQEFNNLLLFTNALSAAQLSLSVSKS